METIYDNNLKSDGWIPSDIKIKLRVLPIKVNGKFKIVSSIKKANLYSISKHIFTVIYEDGIKESFNIANIISPVTCLVQIKKNDAWENMTKDDFKEVLNIGC